ncbi:hypothetical protein HYZ41_02040 [archaeon]|nr:hypothetical protein [archaeon]
MGKYNGEKPSYSRFETYKKIDKTLINKTNITEEHIDNLNSAIGVVAKNYTAIGILLSMKEMENKSEIVKINELNSDIMNYIVNTHIKNSYDVDDGIFLEFFLSNVQNMFPSINGNMRFVVDNNPVEKVDKKYKARGMKTVKKIYKSFKDDALNKIPEYWNRERAATLLNYIKSNADENAKKAVEKMLTELCYSKENVDAIHESVKKIAKTL